MSAGAVVLYVTIIICSTIIGALWLVLRYVQTANEKDDE